MNENERALAVLGVEAVNASLALLGYPLVDANPDIRMAEPVVGEIPNAVVERPGVAPIRIVFGRDLDIWVGPYSGVVTVPSGEETRKAMEDMVTLVLRSEVLCRCRWRSIELILRLPEKDPWRRLRVRGADGGQSLMPRYVPYAG